MKKETGKYPNTKRTIVPLQCMHCEDPACLKACPSGATQRNEDGIVTCDKDICVGCRACMTACPYTARSFIESLSGYFSEGLTPFEEAKYTKTSGVVDKCDFCSSRLREGKDPACVNACVTGARTFGAAEELTALIDGRNGYQMRAELGTNPSVYYLP